MAKQTNYSPTFPMYPGGATTFTNSDTAYLETPSVIYVGVAGKIEAMKQARYDKWRDFIDNPPPVVDEE